MVGTSSPSSFEADSLFSTKSFQVNLLVYIPKWVYYRKLTACLLRQILISGVVFVNIDLRQSFDSVKNMTLGRQIMKKEEKMPNM